MAGATAKTINLLLESGSLQGVISMQDSSWNSGELYSAPREFVDQLLATDACNKFGVYLLLSEDMVYVGQSSDLAQRIKQHKLKKDWWERVVILTKTDNSLNKAHIDYIEYVLIDRAAKGNMLDCDNKKRGNKPNVSKFEKVSLDQYLEEALFLMELIGITVFSKGKCATAKKVTRPLIKAIKNADGATREIRGKSEAKAVLLEQGINISKDWNYAKKQERRNIFWMNPVVEVLDKDWTLVLNNQEVGELIILHIPAGTFGTDEGCARRLCVRPDRKICIELKIDAKTLVDTVSKMDFSTFVGTRVAY